MNAPFTAVKITEDIYWVGAIDWSLRDFHGYATDDREALGKCRELGRKIARVIES